MNANTSHPGIKKPIKVVKRATVNVVNVTGESLPDTTPEKNATAKTEVVPTAMVDRQSFAANDSRYTSILCNQLPSKGIFYDFDEISIRKFTLPELKQIRKAQNTDSFRVLADAISSTMSINASILTPGDFWYFMYWHRINSYLSNPFKVEFVCQHPEHLARIESGELEADTIKGEAFLGVKTKVDLQYVKDEETIGEHILHVQDAFNGLLLYPPRVIDIIEGGEMMDEIAGLGALKEEMSKNREIDVNPAIALNIALKIGETKDEEWMNDLAACIHPQYAPTLVERRDWLLKFSEENDYGYNLLEEIEKFLAMIDHGIIEKVTNTCATCRNEVVSEVATEALTFFP